MAEFYPIDASRVSPFDALQHSLQKWYGLRPVNMVKHNVAMFGDTLTDIGFDADDSLEIDSTSCALCHHYATPPASNCKNCPLTLTHGVNCWSAPKSPWTLWTKHNDPEPMISFIRAALYRQPENEKEQA